MPLAGFPMEMARELEQTCSSELSLNVRTTVHAGRPKSMFASSGQLIAEQVMTDLHTPLTRLPQKSDKTVIVVLTSDDLNAADSGLRYVFAAHDEDRHVSIVSTARMRESFYGLQEDPGKTKGRLYKMVKKTIGIQYYRYARSTDLNSVMYSPVMSLGDLDAQGVRY